MTYKNFLGLVVSLLLIFPAVAQEAAPQLRDGHPSQYVVVRGDTLWGIADRFLSEPWRWPEVWYLNPEIQNPHLIYPGDTIVLSFDGDRPRLSGIRGRPTIRLSPSVRAERLDQAIPTIPIDAIAPFLNETQVLEDGEADTLPYVVAIGGERILAGSRDRIYAKSIEDPETHKYQVVRAGPPYVDPQSGEILGYEGLVIGDAQLQKAGEVATLAVQRSREEILIGDRLIAALEDAVIQRNFMPRAPDFEVDGMIIGVLGGVSQIGQYRVVVLNQGEQDGIQTGHVLSIMEAGAEVRDPYGKSVKDTVVLPDERAGVLMVFRAFDRVSFALVMRVKRALHVGDRVQEP